MISCQKNRLFRWSAKKCEHQDSRVVATNKNCRNRSKHPPKKKKYIYIYRGKKTKHLESKNTSRWKRGSPFQSRDGMKLLSILAFDAFPPPWGAPQQKIPKFCWGYFWWIEMSEEKKRWAISHSKIVPRLFYYPETKPASLHLKMDGWNTIGFSFWGKQPIFRCKLAVSFREGKIGRNFSLWLEGPYLKYGLFVPTFHSYWGLAIARWFENKHHPVSKQTFRQQDQKSCNIFFLEGGEMFLKNIAPYIT